MKLDELIEQVQHIEVNLNYHYRDIQSYKKKLKKDFGLIINENDSKKIRREKKKIDAEIEELEEKAKQLKKKAETKLRKIKI